MFSFCKNNHTIIKDEQKLQAIAYFKGCSDTDLICKDTVLHSKLYKFHLQLKNISNDTIKYCLDICFPEMNWILNSQNYKFIQPYVLYKGSILTSKIISPNDSLKFDVYVAPNWLEHELGTNLLKFGFILEKGKSEHGLLGALRDRSLQNEVYWTNGTDMSILLDNNRNK